MGRPQRRKLGAGEPEIVRWTSDECIDSATIFLEWKAMALFTWRA
jgi:hypothetical protein